MTRICSLLTIAIAFAVLLLVGTPAASQASVANGNVLWSCNYSHTATEDPIKFPDQSPVGHSHDFYGASTTGSLSSWDTIFLSATTCNIPGDRSGYWIPTMIGADGVTQVHATSIGVYWRGIGTDTSYLQPYPDNLQDIQGNSTNTSPNTYAETYRCDNSNTNGVYIPKDCGGYGIEGSIYFPACTTGGPTSADFKPLSCANANDVLKVPQLQILVEYPPAAAGGALSSDYQVAGGLTRPGLTGHADWWNGVDPAVDELLIQKCIDTDPGVQCRVNTNGDVYNPASGQVVVPASQLTGP